MLGAGNNASDSPPPYSLPTTRDENQPFDFNIKMRRQAYRFLFYDTASPTNYTLIRPDFIILCFDISNRQSMDSLKTRWKALVETHYNHDEMLPVMVLGLKRDLRREWTEEERQNLKGASLMPQEGVLVAQEMRCDRYAECSAKTGELFKEAVEDLALTAVQTQDEGRGRTEGGCMIM
jgi:Ras family protein A